MKRRLVIYNEEKRHWFRQQLPSAVLAVDPADMVASQEKKLAISFFLTTYAASFVAFSLYIF
jgi:hypothetical protein